MDETKLEKVCNAVRILIKDQKVQSNKMKEMEKKLEANQKYICKLEKDLNAEKKETDKRFDCVIERFDTLDKVVEEHTDGIDEIEEKVVDLKNKLTHINESLEKINNEIAVLESKKNAEKLKVTLECDIDDGQKDKEEIKQCRFDRVGFCYKGKDNCAFLHVEETCDFYLQHGYCNKASCIRRHPRECYFYRRGFCGRKSDCSYLHKPRKESRQCDRCNQETNMTYYCELCDKSYCSQCTIREAHIKDPNDSKILAECQNVHL